MKLFNDLHYGCKRKYHLVYQQAKYAYSIQISENGIENGIELVENYCKLAQK